jgi:hypothetical protein
MLYKSLILVRSDLQKIGGKPALVGEDTPVVESRHWAVENVLGAVENKLEVVENMLLAVGVNTPVEAHRDVGKGRKTCTSGLSLWMDRMYAKIQVDRKLGSG